jgi:hypothetical protein
VQAVGEGRWGPPLECGPFVAERYRGSLRWLQADGRECVRMVGLVVRDRAWRTLLPGTLRERRARGGWSVEGRTPIGNATLAWRLAIESRPQGMEVRATMRAEGHVVTNRAGIVVLLPAATFAGAAFVAHHASGATTRGRLPGDIAPHQPMLDLGGVHVAARDGPTLSLGFEGEVFEMEDQRNWLDPSFKLYSRALSRPLPYRIRDGASVEQRVTIDIERAGRRVRARPPARRSGRLPRIGLATAVDRVPRDPLVVEAARALAPAFILHRADARAAGVDEAARLAGELHCALRLETFGDSAPLAKALGRVDAQAVAPWLSGARVRGVLARRGVPITGGTFSDFVMLNRNGVARQATRAAFALCPTVHARDDRSLIESIDTLPLLFAQARRLAGDRALDVGPCSLLRRLVPGTGKPATQGPASGDYDIDQRQHRNIAAAWLTCVIAAAAVNGVDSVCTFEVEGARGLVQGARKRERGADGRMRSPAHVLLAAFARHGRARLSLIGLNALRGATFLLEGPGAALWLVDLSGRRRTLDPALRESGDIEQIGSRRDDARWVRAGGAVAPYAIVRIALAGEPGDALIALARAWCDDARPS